MRTRSKLALAGLTAAMVMSLTMSIASARRISLSNQRFVGIWPSLNLSGAGLNVNCPVTLEGSFHSQTLSKVSGALIGYVSSAKTNALGCTGGVDRILTESLPWHLQYNSFTGALPSISGLRMALIGARLRNEVEGFTCLFGTTQRFPGFAIVGVGEGTRANSMEADAAASIPFNRGEFLCELVGEGRFSGRAELFVLGSTSTRVTLRLVQ
jgi:hypothetical protein